jgi:hypothetical protein
VSEFSRRQINAVKREFRTKHTYHGTNKPVIIDDNAAINILSGRKSFREFRDGWHKSHRMTKWQSEIRAPASTARFYSVRRCKKCGHEQMYHAAGRFIDSELKKECRG